MRGALVLIAVWVLAGCASGPPTIELDATAFVDGYMKERDTFVRRTAAAHRKCETLPAIASDTLKARCAALAIEERTWRERDAAILHALLTRTAIDAATLAAVWAVAERVLVLAADVTL